MAGVVLVVGAAACDRTSAGESVTPVVPTSADTAPKSPSATPSTSATPSKAATTATSASTDLPSAPSTVIPTATGSQTPNSPALVKEAEAVVRIFHYELTKAEVAGGATALPPALDATLTGEYRTQMADYLKQAHDAGLVIENAESARIAWMRPADPKAQSSTVAALLVCRDFSGVTVGNREGDRVPGQTTIGTFYLQRASDGSLRIFKTVSQKKVKSC